MTPAPLPRPGTAHPERDPDLLLLAHGALPPWKAALTRGHLARCGDCRRRLTQFQSVSSGFAGAIRGPASSRWSPPGPSAFRPPLWLLAAMLLTTLFLVVLGTLAVRGLHPAPAGSRPPTAAVPCRPDLPSDRCR